MFGYICLFLSALCSAAASIALKYPDRIGLLAISSNAIIIKMPAIAFYGAGFIFYSLGLKDIDVSRAYPLMVSFAILQLMIAGLLLGETISIKMIVGAVFVIFGILLISSK